jgi:hypothetical protein
MTLVCTDVKARAGCPGPGDEARRTGRVNAGRRPTQRDALDTPGPAWTVRRTEGCGSIA